MNDDPRLKLYEMMRNHAWSYFQLHAQQRLTTFNFYLIIASVLTTALIGSLQRTVDQPLLPLAIGVLLAVFSFVFARLDIRNKQLIQNAEQSLEAFEAEWVNQSSIDATALAAGVFTRDARRVEGQRKLETFWSLADRHWSYSDCFRLAFFSLGTLGVGSVCLTLALYLTG